MSKVIVAIGGGEIAKAPPSMWTRRLVAVCVLLFVLSACKGRQEVSQAEPKTAPVAPVQAQTKPSPPQDGPLAETVPSRISDTQARALRRYNENVWFIQEAMQVAQPDETLKGAISTLVKSAAPDWDRSNPSPGQIRGTAISNGLGPWIETTRKLEPPRQAAAWLIADRIVVMEEEDGNLEPQQSDGAPGKTEPSENRPKSVAQTQLENLGAQFSYDPSSERNLYLLNWLQRAYELDSNGRAGELAFLLLMERGFNTSPGCKNGSELFREVLRRGTEYLKHPRDPHIEARVHFMMGDSYRDIVALATGPHGDTYANPATYKPEEANARTNAVAEYRAGLALDDQSETSKIAKERLRSLQAGEDPKDTRFYCEVLD